MTEFEKMYIDQSIENVSVYDRNITSFYTPDGIRRIDARFCKRIQSFKSGEKYTEYSYNYSFRPPKKEVENEWNDTYDSLKKDIEKNIHLHPKIKENLLYNLNL
jgi:hypothetical protein